MLVLSKAQFALLCELLDECRHSCRKEYFALQFHFHMEGETKRDTAVASFARLAPVATRDLPIAASQIRCAKVSAVRTAKKREGGH